MRRPARRRTGQRATVRGDYGFWAPARWRPPADTGFYYNSYDAQRVVASDGTVIGTLQPASDLAVLTGSYSFPSPFLGAHWSASVAVPWTDLALASANLDFPTSWGLSDMYVQPVRAGWKYPRADFVAGFGVFMPTGRFTNGAIDNTGLGMWSYEFTAGTTMYIGSTHQGSVATQVSFQTSLGARHGQAGRQRPHARGRAGHTMVRGAGQVGLVYYAQWKVTDDQNYHLPAGSARGPRVRRRTGKSRFRFHQPITDRHGRYFIELGNAWRRSNCSSSCSTCINAKHHW